MNSPELESIFSSSRINQHLGVELVRAEPGHSCVRMPIESHLVQENSVVHDGILTTPADTPAVYALVPDVTDENQRVTGVEFKMNFQAPARPGAGDLEARRGLECPELAALRGARAAGLAHLRSPGPRLLSVVRGTAHGGVRRAPGRSRLARRAWVLLAQGSRGLDRSRPLAK